MSAAATMRFKLVRQLLVGVHTEKAPLRREWERHCVLIDSTKGQLQGVLIFSRGGGPSSSQRQEMRVAMGGLPAPPTAILTESAWVRGIITSLNWFLNAPIAAFDPNDLKAALDHIGVPLTMTERAAIIDTMSSLAAELGVKLPEYDPISLRAPKRERSSEI